MRIFIELPTWLGDTVMVTPALENIRAKYPHAEYFMMGSKVSIDLMNSFPGLVESYLTPKTIKLTLELKNQQIYYDMAFSFRSSFRSKIFLRLINSNKKFQYDKYSFVSGHQVSRYNDFVNESININTKPGNLILYSKKRSSGLKNQIGINPGAAFGSAKRWTISGFCTVAEELSKDHEILIFGSKAESDICKEIENYLNKRGVLRFKNLCGQTSIGGLVEMIKDLKLFITGDSGPMHIAAAFQVPTISIFGPTRDNETCQWNNKISKIVKTNLPCQPCMERVCPLSHHKCMEEITSGNVLEEIQRLFKKF